MRPGTEMFSDADGRSTETEQRSHCLTDYSKWWRLTVDSLTDGTSRQLAQAERRERRPGRSATRTSWLSYDGAIPWVASYMSTASWIVPVLSREPMEGDECVADVVWVMQAVDEPCCHAHHWLESPEQVGRKTGQDGISVVQPLQYQREDKSLERSRWHWMTNWT